MQELRERLVFGCCSLSANNTKRRALEILKFARVLGFKFFDTHLYTVKVIRNYC